MTLRYNSESGDWRTNDNRFRLRRVQNELQRSNFYWVIKEYHGGFVVENNALRGSHHSRALAKAALERHLARPCPVHTNTNNQPKET